MISETIYSSAAILIPAIGLLAVIVGIVLLILKKKILAFKESRPIRKLCIYFIVWGCIGLLAGLLIVICYLPYLRANAV